MDLSGGAGYAVHLAKGVYKQIAVANGSVKGYMQSKNTNAIPK